MKSRSFAAFTLVELLVSIAIMGIVASITMGAMNRVREAQRATQCLSNQKQISHALQMFYNDTRGFPGDAPNATLRASLADYVNKQRTFNCPADPDSASTTSYDPYYVRRRRTDGEVMFTLGCPRHKDAKHGASLFDNGSASLVKLGEVRRNGKELAQNLPEADRTFTSGQIDFEDKSTVDVLTAGSDFGLTMVQSFRLGDGTLYTVVRMRGDGKIDCAVTPGSKFEVVTPSAVVGVRGTQFTVETSNDETQTDVDVTSGHVWVKDRVNGAVRTLSVGQSVTEINENPDCIHCSKHCRVGKTNKGQGGSKGKGKKKGHTKEKHCSKCPMHPSYGS